MSEAINKMFCNACGSNVSGNYCSNCGEIVQASRITLKRLLHEILHLFTHLDKGFAFTLKELIVSPGHMQSKYIEGLRSKYQKPFSMFFICGTIAALSRYWISWILLKYYHSGNLSEASFFHEYMLLLHLILLPLYILIIYFTFSTSRYNYAETGVMFLYLASVFFLLSFLIMLLKFIWPEMDTAYVEFPLLIIYNAITFINFYADSSPWKIMLKSIVIITAIFFLVQVAEDFIVRLL